MSEETTQQGADDITLNVKGSLSFCTMILGLSGFGGTGGNGEEPQEPFSSQLALNRSERIEVANPDLNREDGAGAQGGDCRKVGCGSWEAEADLLWCVSSVGICAINRELLADIPLRACVEGNLHHFCVQSICSPHELLLDWIFSLSTTRIMILYPYTRSRTLTQYTWSRVLQRRADQHPRLVQAVRHRQCNRSPICKQDRIHTIR